jgi:hypothetical protein
MRGAGHRGAVIGVVAADDHLPIGLAEQIPVAAHHAHVGVVAFGAGAGEEHVAEVAGALADFGEQLGEFDRRRRGSLEERVVEREFLHLARGGVDQGALAIAHVHAPQAGHGIEDLVAFAVPDVDAFATDDDARAAACEGFEVGEGMEEVGCVSGLPVGRGAGGLMGGGGHQRSFWLSPSPFGRGLG